MEQSGRYCRGTRAEGGDGGAVNAETESAAEAKRQAVRRAMSQEERKHSEKVAFVVLGACIIFLLVFLVIIN